MTQPSTERLRHLCEVVEREVQHLQLTDRHLFAEPFTASRAEGLNTNHNEADRVESFVARFGRLQDTTGDKLLPQVLAALGEHVASFADNLDRAEKLGWIASADDWFTMRALRNQMVHEYVEDPVILWNALDAGQRFTPPLAQAAHAMCQEMVRRSWVSV